MRECTQRWDVIYGQTRDQRIERMRREGLVMRRKDGELDMRYSTSRFIANPQAGVLA